MPIKLIDEKVDLLMEQAKNKNYFTIKLEDQTIGVNHTTLINFEIDPFRKKCLLEGLDDIALTLKKEEKIDLFENTLHQSYPWIL